MSVGRLLPSTSVSPQSDSGRSEKFLPSARPRSAIRESDESFPVVPAGQRVVPSRSRNDSESFPKIWPFGAPPGTTHPESFPVVPSRSHGRKHGGAKILGNDSNRSEPSRSPPLYKGGNDSGAVGVPPPLPDLLARLRVEGWRIKVTPAGVPQLIGPDGRPGDVGEQTYHMLNRYFHAFVVAAAGTHQAWWDHVSGRVSRALTINDELPGTADDDAYACVTCGEAAETVDSNLLAWCKEHR